MSIIQAFTGAISGTIADQWKDIITASAFDEHSAVVPGVFKTIGNGQMNPASASGVLTNGSKIFVPENTAAFVFSQAGIESIMTEAGGYEYTSGQDSIFNGTDPSKAIVDQIKNRFAFGGISDDEKRVAFVNLREVRNIKFGTRGPQLYHDSFYGTDLEIRGYGTFSLQIIDPVKFIKNFVPANVSFYSFDDANVRAQLLAEFLHSFAVALNSLSADYRISQLPAMSSAIAQAIMNDQDHAGSWRERFGFNVVSVAIENIEFMPESRELVKQYSSKKMNLKAYDDVSQKASDIAAQQKIAQGIEKHGLGNVAGMIFGMNMGKGLSKNASPKKQLTFDEQVDALKKLKELLDADIITQEEFEAKKKDIMGL